MRPVTLALTILVNCIALLSLVPFISSWWRDWKRGNTAAYHEISFPDSTELDDWNVERTRKTIEAKAKMRVHGVPGKQVADETSNTVSVIMCKRAAVQPFH